jgi:serine-type D-Ala-D-Ala carboxypeptidase (penicillin-binding protein 5/6)
MLRYILVSLFFLLSHLHAQLDVDVKSDAAILINADTGAIIYEKNSRTPHYPASITKVATALYALEKTGGRLDEMVEAKREAVASVTEKQRESSNFKINPHWIEVGGTHIGIKSGEILPLEALLYGMMLSSGNDAANVIAQHVGEGSIDHFIAGMNDYVQTLGATDTRFVCAHGHHHPDHITTAYDMALIAKRAMEIPAFKKIVSTEKYRRPKTNKQNPVTLVQTNKLLRPSSNYYYKKAIGIKTGHGSRAKETLVAAAEFNGRTLIAVLLHAKERRHIFEDAVRLFNEAFKQPKLAKNLVEPGPQRYTLKLKGASRLIHTHAIDGYRLEYHKGEDPDVKAWLVWVKDLQLPVQKDQKVGELIFAGSDRKIVKRVPLLAQKEVGLSLTERGGRFFRGQSSLIEYSVALFIIALLVILRMKWVNRRL